MFDDFRDQFLKIVKNRTIVMSIVFFLLFGVVIYKLFDLQIVNGENAENEFITQIEKERSIDGTRGSIYDANGTLLAESLLSYNITIEDNGSYETTAERDLTLNSTIYKLNQLVASTGDSLVSNFGIIVDESGKYAFTSTGQTLARFKADVFGYSYIDDMKEDEANATADEIMEHLAESYGLVSDSYSSEDFEEYGIPDTFTAEETLSIVSTRYSLNLNSYQKYVAVKIASDINETTMAVVSENKDTLQGVEIAETTTRVYYYSIYFSNIIGYTGTISETELTEYLTNDEESDYTATDIVGKDGIEQYFESELRGRKGYETVYVDNLGTELEVITTQSPEAGEAIYLSLVVEDQIAAYNLVEQYVAGLVLANLKNYLWQDRSLIDETTKKIDIPIGDVYYALIDNNILDITNFSSASASSVEQTVYSNFLSRQVTVLGQITALLESDSAPAYIDSTLEMKNYMSYIVDNILSLSGVLDTDAIDTTDQTYIDWKTNETISLREFLLYAISKNWIDISQIDESYLDEKYLDSNQVYSELVNYITDTIKDDTGFSKLIYRFMIIDGSGDLTGRELCLMLYDQGILAADDETYNALMSDTLSSFDFLYDKIYNLEITPAQLALDPCSGSLVIVDADTGALEVCMTYPGYDNNKLANTMDSEYFYKLNNDLSSPFYSRATRELTAPGSTFKLISAISGVNEGVISVNESINCTGIFNKIAGPEIKCWNQYGHGELTLQGAIGVSCNYFFNEIGFRFGVAPNNLVDEDGKEITDDDEGIAILTKYAKMFGLGETSGIEISESTPRISQTDSSRSAMGQAEHGYTTTQLAKYVNGIANSGTVYDLTLISKITDYQENIIYELEPVVYNEVEATDAVWDAIHNGMYQVVSADETASKELEGLGLKSAGKTGTAQQDTSRSNHGLFVGYAPFDDPEISIAVRVTNGYSSKTALTIASDYFKYRFNLVEDEVLFPGTAVIMEDASNSTND